MTASQSPGAMMLEKLRKGLDNFRDCIFPGLSDFPISLVPLSVDELQNAYAEAEKRFRDLEIEITVLTAEDFSSEVHVQVLFRSLRDPKDRTVRLFGSAEDLRRNISQDERILLTDEYIELEAESNPLPDDVPDEVFSQIEQAIKKKGSRSVEIYRFENASELFAFFGKPAIELTFWQILEHANRAIVISEKNKRESTRARAKPGVSQNFQVVTRAERERLREQYKRNGKHSGKGGNPRR